MHCLNICPLMLGSVLVNSVNFNYYNTHVVISIYFNNLMVNPYQRDYDYYYQSSNRVFDVPCLLNQFVFRNTHTNEIFQAEYPGACDSYGTNHVQIRMNPRDYLRLVVNEFVNTTSTTIPLEMYTADMIGAPFNLRIEPDDPIECDARLYLYSVGITDIDYWTNEGILLIHFNTFIEVATVNVSKLSLSRNYYQDANNTVNITSGEILNQSPGLTSSVAIRLTLTDLALVGSKGICTEGGSCRLVAESGFAAAYYGRETFSTNNYVNNFRSAPTGEQNLL